MAWYTIPGKIEKPTVTWMLDTGASSIVIYRSVAEKAGFKSNEEQKTQGFAGNTPIQIQPVLLHQIEVTGHVYNKVTALVIDDPPEGSEQPFNAILGLDFLKNHQAEINFKKPSTNTMLLVVNTP